nr:TIGR02281 family clan AA aspartic protease [Acuticoccus mangrovi]
MRSVRLPEIVRTSLFWLIAIVALVGLYAYRVPLQSVGREVAAVLVPGVTVQDGESVVVRRSFGGHFEIEGTVDGAPVRFLFDTGASTVVLSAEDAARAGFDPDALDYRVPVVTAGGMTEVAPVRLPDIAIGGIRMESVRAAVARPGELDRSLLGMSFLNRLSGYDVRRDRLVLIP